ncbi:uncharacterized protein [Palaemon carinicauda]|uniref:uncharacterized protein n=1 Tax=Palaemon carinicauda TaxID=392227 RepID=UPI0035B65BAE
MGYIAYTARKNKHGIQSCHRFQSLNLEDRWNAVVDAKLCFRCLNVAHNPKPVKKNLRVATEAGTTSNVPPDRTNTETAPEAGTPATTGHVHAMSTDRRPDSCTMLKLIPVMVNGTCSMVGFIDGEAAPTLATRSLIDRLGVTGRPCNQIMVTEADYIMPSDWLKRWPHMADVELQSMPTDHEQVQLVIGLDTTLNRVILEQRHGTANEPSAYLTKLGWVAFGPTGDRLEDSLEDKRFLATLNNTTQHQHGKYVAKLPFKDSTPLPDNMNMAIRRA